MTLFTLNASAIRGGDNTPDKDYLCFTANEAGASVVLSASGSSCDVTLQTSTNGADWNEYACDNFITLADAGDKVYFRNAKTASEVAGFSTGQFTYYYFYMDGSIGASGNVMSLVDKDCASTTIPCDYCFFGLFAFSEALTSAPELPATTLSEGCYSYMFHGCTSLTSAPELPATTLSEGCYSYMFTGCTNLKTAPELPATTLAPYCYQSMFEGCTSLTSAPELPATTLSEGCYNNMFSSCTSLTSVPELPATTLSVGCYQNMFSSCTSLTSAPELPATTLALDCYNKMFCNCQKFADIKVAFSDWNSVTNGTLQWVKDVASTSTFSCPEGLEQTTGESGIPEGWTVKNTYDLAITSETGWASMCVNLPLIVPTGVDVYYASAASGNTIELTQIEAGTVMAAKTAVIVKGAKGTVSFPIAGEAGTSFTNLFQGSSVDKACNAGENYVLNASMSSDTSVHFSIYTGTTLTNHKAWLPKSAVGGASNIQFRFADTTAISTMETEVAEDVIYNLAGQRVGNDYRGLGIKNGKKTWNN